MPASVRSKVASTLPLLLLTVALLLAACSPPAENPAGSEPTTDPEPGDQADDAEPDAGEPDEPDDEAGANEATAYFVRAHEGEQWVEPETHDLAEPTVAVGRAAMELLVAGEPRNPELTTLVPEGTRVRDVNIADGVMTVDLSGELAAGSGASAQEVALAHQLVHTATQFDSVDALVVWVDGEPIEELWGHLDWSQPLEPSPHALSPIVVTSPRWGETVPAGPVTVSGHSLTFEATVELQLTDPDGVVVEEAVTTAAQPEVDQRGDFTLTFETEADRPGTWTVTGIEPDPSDGEGRPPLVTTVQFTVE